MSRDRRHAWFASLIVGASFPQLSSWLGWLIYWGG